MASSDSASAPAPIAQDKPVVRSVTLFVALAIAALSFRAVEPFMTSTRGVAGPLVVDSERPAVAALAIFVAFAVVSAAAALVGRLVNAIVGLFVLGTGVGYLAMRCGSSIDFCFGGSSILAAGIELVAWTVLAAAGSHLVFKVGGRLSDVPFTGEDEIDSPTGPAARKAWLAALAGVGVAWLVAASATKGQAIGAATLAGFATGAIGRMISPRTTPVYLAAAPIGAFAALFLYLGFTTSGDLAAGFAQGALGSGMGRFLRLMPVDIAAGALCGTSLGFGFVRSFASPDDA